MITQSLRASRLGLARIARQQAVNARRTFVVTTTRRADIVQDMYLKELKNYKVPQPKAGEEKGQVQEFKTPAAPQSPEEQNLTNELSSYESAEVEVEGGVSEDGPAAAGVDQWFENIEDEEGMKEEEEKEAH